MLEILNVVESIHNSLVALAFLRVQMSACGHKGRCWERL